MTGTAAVFGAAGNAEEENISLETLSKDAVEKIMTAYKAGRDVADHYYTATVEPALIRRYNVYRADTDHYREKFKTLSEYSDWVSRDVKTTIDWIMPSLMEVFTGSDDPVDIAGVNVSDDDNAKKIQQLISYFVTRKNSFSRSCTIFCATGSPSTWGAPRSIGNGTRSGRRWRCLRTRR